jgi:hypothetical protein
MNATRLGALVTKFGLVLAAATGIATTIGGAKADIVDISYSTTINGALIPLASGAGGATFSGPIAGTSFTSIGNSISGFSSPTLGLPDLLNSGSLNLTGTAGGGTIFIWITDSGITAPNSGTFPYVSTLTSNSLINGAKLTMETFLDANNGIANQNLLTDTVIAGPTLFTTLTTAVDTTSVPVGAGPYSIIAMYEVAAPRSGSGANATIDVSVPGPIVGAGLPGLLAACGGLVALARRRRRRAA